LKFGLVYPNKGGFCDKQLLTKSCGKAESLGYDSFLLWDHFIQPDTPKTFESWSAICYLAGKTETIRLGTCVTPVPLWNPAILAKKIATADNLSEGRVIFGAGAGRLEDEFGSFNPRAIFNARFAMFEEAVKYIVELWTQPFTKHTGKYYRSGQNGTCVEPKPIQQPHVPIWVGSNGRRLLSIIADVAAGWIPYPENPEVYIERKRELEGIMSSTRADRTLTFAAHVRGSTQMDELQKSVENLRLVGCEYVAIPLRFKPEDALTGIESIYQTMSTF
jgi:alkanesulfonate monooxygenase SsuD/methylene tetrahydromethanopterin reductase-like flavin-dependent oxidoreductase (luciferase family)